MQTLEDNERTAEACALLSAGTREQVLKGVGLLNQAYAGGDGDAALLLAVIDAAGLGRPPDWVAAMDKLAFAASRGVAFAQAQMRLICGAENDDVDWNSQRQRFSLSDWTHAPTKQNLCDAPRVRRISQFVGKPICDWLRARAIGRFQRAMVFDHEGGVGTVDPRRTNSEFEFTLMESDVVLLLVRARMSAAMAIPVQAFEPTKILHYAPGQHYASHVDFLEPDDPVMAEKIAIEGQRIATLLVYLNDDYEGGETEFPRVGIKHRGGAGDALYFANVDGAGAPDRMTLHAGCAPTVGEKLVLSQWVRNRPFLK